MKKSIIIFLVIKYILLSLTEVSLFCQTPLITDKKQIKETVRNEIVSSSPDFLKLKSDVANSTKTLKNNLDNLSVLLSSETQSRINADNQINIQIQDLQNKMNNATNTFLLKGGDTTDGNYTFNGGLTVGSMGIWTNGDITSLGTIQANKFVGDGSGLTGISGGFSYPYTTNYFHIGDTDVYGRKRLWFYDYNSVFKLGGAISDGDGLNADSDGIVVINNSQDKMARIKADRLGLTRSSDSSYYYFRVDPDKLFYKSTDTTSTRFYIDNNTGNIGIGNSNPSEKLDVNGNIKVKKIFTQDWTEIPVSTNAYTGYIQYRVLGNETCVALSVKCSLPDGYSCGNGYTGTIPYEFSTNFPVAVFYAWIVQINYFSEPFTGIGSAQIYVYNNGNIYNDLGVSSNEELYSYFCFRNKL
jgi:hypothetical protein